MRRARQAQQLGSLTHSCAHTSPGIAGTSPGAALRMSSVDSAPPPVRRRLARVLSLTLGEPRQARGGRRGLVILRASRPPSDPWPRTPRPYR